MDAFQIHRGELVSLVGGGGKTSTLFTLGKEAMHRGIRVVITTTTRILLSEAVLGQHIIMAEGSEIFEEVKKGLTEFPLIVAGSGIGEGDKLLGVEKNVVSSFLKAGADIVLVEADGSAGLPFKAPRDGEPVIPAETTVVVPVVGIDCLGRPLLPHFIHRPEIVAALTGKTLGQKVDPQTVADVFFHPRGYSKGIPSGSRWIPFINKVDNNHQLEMARELAERMGQYRSGRVVVGAALSTNPVKEVLDF